MGEFVKSLPKSTDMGGVQGALQQQKEPPAPPPPTTQVTEQLRRWQRNEEFRQAQGQAAATRVTPAERDYTEAISDQPITLDVDAVISPDKLGKKLTPNERDRRKILAGFNTLTQPQQNLILDTFDNDEAQLIAYVRREKPPVVVKQFATLARVNEDAFKVNIPKPAKPLKRGETNATQPGTGAEGAKPAGERAGKNRGAG